MGQCDQLSFLAHRTFVTCCHPDLAFLSRRRQPGCAAPNANAINPPYRPPPLRSGGCACQCRTPGSTFSPPAVFPPRARNNRSVNPGSDFSLPEKYLRAAKFRPVFRWGGSTTITIPHGPLPPVVELPAPRRRPCALLGNRTCSGFPLRRNLLPISVPQSAGRGRRTCSRGK